MDKSKDILKRAQEALKKAADEKRDSKRKNEEDRTGFIKAVGSDLVDVLVPLMEQVAENSKLNRAELQEAIGEAMKNIQVPKAEVAVSLPEMTIPEIKLPVFQVPEVKVPSINIPEIKVPNIIMPDRMMAMLEYDANRPLPVIMMGQNGKPFQFTTPSATSGKADFITIKGYSASAFSEIMNPDGRVKVELPTGSSGLTNTELRAAHLDVQQLSGSVDSVYVTGIFGSTMSGTEMLNADNRLRVSLETGGSGLTDAELRATAVPVSQVSGANWSTSVTNTVTVDGSGVTQPVSGTVTVASITATTATNIVDSTGVAYSGSNPVPISDAAGSITIDGTVTVSSITASTAASIIDSGGVQYSGSNPLPITMVTSSVTSTIAVGDLASDAADTGSAPLKTGGIARTANPTAVANGDRVATTYDDLGRQLMRPLQVRDLIKTAYVSVANGTETTLLAATAGSFHDLIMITATNNSSAATQLDIRCTTAGNIIHTMYLPATTGPVGWAPSVPWPQDATGNNWTIDMPDQTGTTVYVSALFTQEV